MASWSAARVEEIIRADHQRFGSAVDRGCESVDLVFRAGAQDMKLQSTPARRRWYSRFPFG